MPYLVSPALPAGHLGRRPQPVLEVSEHLILRPWRADDAPAVRAAFDCPRIQRWHVLRMDSDAEALDWIAGWERHWRDEQGISWAIADRRDGRPLGQIGLRAISLFEADAGVSYWTLPAERGRGLATQAVRTLTAWALGDLGLNRLRLMHSVANEASCRVAAKAGYALEGTLRGAGRHADGWHDMHLHARAG